MKTIHRVFASMGDWGACALMNIMQRRHPLTDGSYKSLEDYIDACSRLDRDEYYRVSPMEKREMQNGGICWESPIKSGFRENDRVYADLFPCEKGWSAPTVLFLHALMSASDKGYRAWARRFNEQGWNACFVHLPYHYSRRPRGYFNGELAITADLVRTGEGLRQAVVELRQLMDYLRSLGCREFGLWATSYGGWIGALLSFLEKDFRFVSLMTPIVDVLHAIWQSPASTQMRREIVKQRVTEELIGRHSHLTSPLHGTPLSHPSKILIMAGSYDRVVREKDLKELYEKWGGSHFYSVPQGHFGYRIMPEMFRLLMEQGYLNNQETVVTA